MNLPPLVFGWWIAYKWGLAFSSSFRRVFQSWQQFHCSDTGWFGIAGHGGVREVPGSNPGGNHSVCMDTLILWVVIFSVVRKPQLSIEGLGLTELYAG